MSLISLDKFGMYPFAFIRFLVSSYMCFICYNHIYAAWFVNSVKKEDSNEE